MHNRGKLFGRSLVLAAMLVLTPLVYTPTQGVQVDENSACAREADGVSCKRRFNDICTDGKTVLWDHYNYYTI